MTEYGIMINNQLIRHKQYHDGDKPIIYTDMPTREYVCTYAFEERNDGIYQVWTVTDVPIVPIEDEATIEDYEAALAELGVK